MPDFILHANIANCKELLAAETDPRKVARIRRLLVEKKPSWRIGKPKIQKRKRGSWHHSRVRRRPLALLTECGALIEFHLGGGRDFAQASVPARSVRHQFALGSALTGITARTRISKTNSQRDVLAQLRFWGN